MNVHRSRNVVPVSHPSNGLAENDEYAPQLERCPNESALYIFLVYVKLWGPVSGW